MTDEDLELERYVVAAEDRGERLDKWLAVRTGRSRATLQRWLREGRVLVDGATAEGSARVKEGSVVEVRPASPPPSSALPEDISLAILYEDEHLVVIDKAPGMVVHPAAGHRSGTLVNALLHRFGALAPGPLEAGTSERPGIVHRIDRGTSGVLVVARTELAREHLAAGFAAHTVERAYLAIATGDVPAAVTYDTLYGRHPRERKKFSSQVQRGKRAVTHVERIERLHGACLVRCRLETGRTHQIRVHLADARHPLLGDPVYARSPRDARLKAAAERLGRQALHAAKLGFVHPITSERLVFETEPPEDFRAALAMLRG
ncbi:MAG: RluA family pseudouridine synthase [Sandaracinaceae bacterium]